MSASTLVSRRPTDALSQRAYCLTLALAHGYPRLTFRPGQTVLAGSRNWGLFLRETERDRDAVTAAIEALETLEVPA